MRVEDDVWREAGLGERQVFHRVDARADTLLAVPTRELVAYDRVALVREHDGDARQRLAAVVVA